MKRIGIWDLKVSIFLIIFSVILNTLLLLLLLLLLFRLRENFMSQFERKRISTDILLEKTNSFKMELF